MLERGKEQARTVAVRREAAPAMLHIVSAGEQVRSAPYEIEVQPTFGQILGIELFDATIAELMKPRPVEGQIRLADGELVATLSDLRVSVSRLRNPHPTPQKPYNYIVLGLSYYITSHGYTMSVPSYATDGQGAMPANPNPPGNHTVRFHGQGGTPVLTWAVQPPFWLECGWDHKYKHFSWTGEEVVPWLDMWDGNWTHEVNAWFYSC